MTRACHDASTIHSRDHALIQEGGQPVQLLDVGDVVWCPPDVKHWHGAVPDSAMTHVAITSTAAGQSVAGMKKVSDAEYNRR